MGLVNLQSSVQLMARCWMTLALMPTAANPPTFWENNHVGDSARLRWGRWVWTQVMWTL